MVVVRSTRYLVPGTGNGIVMHPYIHLAIFGAGYQVPMPGTRYRSGREENDKSGTTCFVQSKRHDIIYAPNTAPHACMFHIYGIYQDIPVTVGTNYRMILVYIITSLNG